MGAKDNAETLTVDGREVRVTQPRQAVLLARGEALEARHRPLLPRRSRTARWPASAIGRSCSSASSTAPRASRSIRSARPTKRPDWLRTVTLSFPSGRTAEEVVVDDAAGLAWIVNLGCIELHPHPVRAGDLDHPDELRVDLDPGPGVAWADVRRVALEVKALLDELGLRGWPKTSGSRGMHVNVRIEPRWTFTEVRRAALALSREIERRAPDARDARSGGRRSATACSSTTTRTRRTARPARRIRCGRCPTRASRRRSTGTRCPTASRPTSRCSRCRRASRTLGDPHAGMDDARGLARGAARARGARRSRGPRRRALAAALPQDGGRGAARRAVAREAAPARSRRRRAPKMPLIIVANSPDKDAALAGLERWKARHPEAAAHLAVDDVLVDSMRGRSSTWTRIRVNLRNVPEAIAPAAGDARPRRRPDPRMARGDARRRSSANRADASPRSGRAAGSVRQSGPRGSENLV